MKRMMKYIAKRCFSFLKEPAEGFEKEWNTTILDAFKYMLVLAIITSVLGAVVMTISGDSLVPFLPDNLLTGFGMPIAFVINLTVSYVFIITVSIVLGLWLHLWAYGLKARGGVGQTLKSVFYGQTPTYLFGWIPFVGLGASVWSMFLVGIGITKLHFIGREDAALSILAALMMPGVFLVIYAIFFI